MTDKLRDSSERPGKSKLPVRSRAPASTSGLRQVLEQLKDRPEVLGLSELDPAAIETGLALRKARRIKGLTQAQVADKAGITQGAVSNIERGAGKDGPSARVVRQIAAALDAEWVLKPVAEGSAASAAEGREFGDLVKVTTGKRKLHFIGAGGGPAQCWPIVKSVLPAAAYEEMMHALIEVAGPGIGDEFGPDGMCGFWKLQAHGKSRLSVRAPVLAIAFNGQGKVAIPDRMGAAAYDQVVIANCHQTIELQNDGGEALSVMTVVITSSEPCVDSA